MGHKIRRMIAPQMATWNIFLMDYIQGCESLDFNLISDFFCFS